MYDMPSQSTPNLIVSTGVIHLELTLWDENFKFPCLPFLLTHNYNPILKYWNDHKVWELFSKSWNPWTYTAPIHHAPLHHAPAYGPKHHAPNPIYTFVKTDPHANFKWGVKHLAGVQYGK